MAGATPVHIPMESENGKFISPIEQIEASITPNTKILVVNTPHNPTGVVLSKEELQELANLATKHNLIVVSDEMYEKIIADETPHYSIASFPGMAERTITINGFSKAYAMTGWRVGYLHAPTAYYPAIFRVHQFNTACTPGFAQQAALTLLKDGERAVTEMKESFQRRRVLLQSALEKATNLTVMEATGAIYLFVLVQHNDSNIRDFALRLLDETGVACVPGTAFGSAGEGYLRLSYATFEEDLLEAAKRLVAYVG
nr:aminotransferase class I/II-fold pyridoxal phosphate-dependent enzyme [Geomicrobium sp. JCM 19038]